MPVVDETPLRSSGSAAQPHAGSLLLGTSLVAYLLAFGRWGSHVRVPSTAIYITDVLLATALIAWWLADGRREAVRDVLRRAPLVLLIAALAVIRLIAGGLPSLVALRDAAPYCYAIAVVLPFARRRPDAERRTLAVLHIALVVRLVCVLFALSFPGVVARLPEISSPGPDAHVLSLRADFDSATLVVLAVLTAVRLMRLSLGPLRRAAEGAMLALTVAAIVKVQSRAGMLALLAGVAIVGVVALWPAMQRAAPRTRIAALLLTVAAVVVVVPQAAVFQRIADVPAALGIGSDPSDKQSDATGTAKARLHSWGRTVDYTNETAQRRAIGVGFGPDFLHQAQAAFVFEGSIYSGVRAPHNYFLNTFARLGYVGVIVVVLAFGQVLVSAARLTTPTMRELTLLCVTLFIALLIIATLGVVLESPFGAVPAFWAAGWILLSRHRIRRGDSPDQDSRPTLSGRDEATRRASA